MSQITHVRRVRNQFSDEYLLVRVEGVNDQAHQLSDLGLEGEGLHLAGVRHAHVLGHFLTALIGNGDADPNKSCWKRETHELRSTGHVELGHVRASAKETGSTMNSETVRAARDHRNEYSIVARSVGFYRASNVLEGA